MSKGLGSAAVMLLKELSEVIRPLVRNVGVLRVRNRKKTYFSTKTVHCTYLGVSNSNLKKKCISSLKVIFTFTNRVDPDEMQHYAAFHLGLYCLQKYPFRGLPEY